MLFQGNPDGFRVGYCSILSASTSEMSDSRDFIFGHQLLEQCTPNLADARRDSALFRLLRPPVRR